MSQAEVMDRLIQGAKTSSWGLRKMNFILKRAIPFNAPHRIRVESISEKEVLVSLPYRKSNLNHLRGIHACAIATLAEYTSGIYLLQKARSSGYRIIMKSLHVEYLYQAKTGVSARFGMDDAAYEKRVAQPLAAHGVVLDNFVVEVHDSANNHIATATMEWQLKDWKKTSSKKL